MTSTSTTVLVREPGQKIIALIGQPNVGKSTVFNMLTGLSQHVGNWPGKTVEQKVGTYRQNGHVVSLVDLPGTYSLTANSEEERIARDYLIQERPDVVIAVVNAAQLERNLYLVAELLSLPQPLVLGLNMLDVAEQHGTHVEPRVLEAALGVPVVSLVATRNQGVKELMDKAIQLADHPEDWAPNRPAIRAEHSPVLAEMRDLIAGRTPPRYPEDWVALKLLEGDAEITALMQQTLPDETWQRVHEVLVRHEDAYLDIAGGRYEWIGRMVRAAVSHPKAGAISLTDRVDHVATHPLWGLLALMGMFGLVFWLTYTLATPLANWLSAQVLGALDAAAARAAGLGAGVAVRPRFRRPHPWRGHRLHVPAHPGDLLRHAGRAGRRRLPGAGRLRHRSFHAPDGAAWQIVSAAVPGVWLQRSGRVRSTHHRRAARPAADHPARAVGALHRTAGGDRLPGPRLFRARGGADLVGAGGAERGRAGGSGA